MEANRICISIADNGKLLLVDRKDMESIQEEVAEVLSHYDYILQDDVELKMV